MSHVESIIAYSKQATRDTVDTIHICISYVMISDVYRVSNIIHTRIASQLWFTRVSLDVSFRCRCVWIPFSKPQSQLFLFLYIHVCTSTYLYIHVHIYTYKQHRTNAKTTYLQLTRFGFPLRSSLYEIVVSAKWPSRTMFVISYHRGSFIDKV